MKAILRISKPGAAGRDDETKAMTFAQLPRAGEYVWLKDDAVLRVKLVVHLEHTKDADAEIYAIELGSGMASLVGDHGPEADWRGGES
jgi:hypothetical protein